MEEWYWKEDELFQSIYGPPEPERTTDYLIRLLEEPAFLVDRFSLAQIRQGLWYVAAHTSCSTHMKVLFCDDVPLLKRKRCVEAMFSLYENLFRTACQAACSHRSRAANPLNGICYMWWDLIPNGVKKIYPKDYYTLSKRWRERVQQTGVYEEPPRPRVDPESLVKNAEMHETMLATVQRILEIPHTACHEGALHGLGHFKEYFPDRVTTLIDHFLEQTPDMPAEIRQYALAARRGRVQ